VTAAANGAERGAERGRWRALAWMIPVAIVVVAVAILGARWLRTLPAVQAFLTAYPGHSELPAWAPVGFPAWLAWQHGISALLILLILRTGFLLRRKERPDTFWTRNNQGLLRTKGAPVRIGIQLWFHYAVDVLWMLNGLLFYVLLFCTGQWVRIVPTRWDIVPNAISAGLQYLSMDWPAEDSWLNYNALQVLSYGAVVFLLAPLAILTGLRLAPGLAGWWRRYEKAFPLALARTIHSLVMWLFCGFIVVHVVLVFTTGMLRNLNHMYGGSDAANWVGFLVFAGTVVLMVVAWIGLRPGVLRAVAGTMGTVKQLPTRKPRPRP
jgi:thiosulfate reductase cytochrome b subunit